jgi:hypothetical protein
MINIPISNYTYLPVYHLAKCVASETFDNSDGSRNFEKGAYFGERERGRGGGHPSNIAKNYGILGL